MGISWQAALSGVFISGLIFVALSLTGFREKIINAIPPELKLAVGAGSACLLHLLDYKVQESLQRILLRSSRSETFTAVLCC